MPTSFTGLRLCFSTWLHLLLGFKNLRPSRESIHKEATEPSLSFRKSGRVLFRIWTLPMHCLSSPGQTAETRGTTLVILPYRVIVGSLTDDTLNGT
ncbi:hypothetical protein EDB80DRAFT_718079 [Ilyonectria destructans]|nr:hypothetical protein EDB80DRAFT_718079 [Ilyonectria destructans]